MRLAVIFEGGEFAGKGAAIRSFMEHLNPRAARVVALPKPTEAEAGQWYFQRYVEQLPKPGEIVFYDRSWYNRALVEPVNGFCTKDEYKRFMKDVIHFEALIHNDGIVLVKFYLSITKTEQARRIQRVRNNPLRRWELSQVDEDAQRLWDKYQQYEKNMLEKTDTKDVPWTVVDSNDQRAANLACIRAVLAEVKSNR